MTKDVKCSIVKCYLPRIKCQATDWQWEERCNQTVKQIKTLLKSRKCFASFDVKKPVKLQVDACKKRLGAEN